MDGLLIATLKNKIIYVMQPAYNNIKR